MPDSNAVDSLESRVDAYLRSTHSTFVVEERENHSLRALLDELAQAEQEFATAHARVVRLKHAVAEAQFDKAAQESVL